MSVTYTYLLINVCASIVCLFFSFHPRIRFDRQFVPFIKAATLTAIPFLAWDIAFTHAGVWWFNDRYVLGIRFLGLPLEEYLFFLCIPFACIFTYFCLYRFRNLSSFNICNNLIVFLLTVVCTLAALLLHKHIYTFTVTTVAVLLVLLLHFTGKAAWIGEATVAYAILLCGFFPVNGLLTGTGLQQAVVNYHPEGISGFRILTIPIEDFLYGYIQFLLTVYFFHLFRRRNEEPDKKIPCTIGG